MRALIGLTLLFTLALAGSAAAKEVSAVRVCGADGCHRHGPTAARAALEGGGYAEAPKRAAPSFRLRFTVSHGEQADEVGYIRMLYVPSAELVQYDDGTWTAPATSALQALNRLVRGATPFPATGSKLAEEQTDPAPAAAVAPAPPRPPSDGMSDAVWAFLVAGAAGVVAALAVAGRTLVARRRGPAEAG